MKTFISRKSSIFRTFQLLRSTVASAFAGTRKRNAAVPWLVALAFTLTAQQGHACTLIVTGVNFGSYDVFSNTALDSTGNIDVNWTGLLEMKVNELLRTTVSVHLIYDDDVVLEKQPSRTEVNDQGVITTIPAVMGPGTQFKEVLSVGLSYKL
mgnify:CR=1 FL=1